MATDVEIVEEAIKRIGSGQDQYSCNAMQWAAYEMGAHYYQVYDLKDRYVAHSNARVAGSGFYDIDGEVWRIAMIPLSRKAVRIERLTAFLNHLKEAQNAE